MDVFVNCFHGITVIDLKDIFVSCHNGIAVMDLKDVYESCPVIIKEKF